MGKRDDQHLGPRPDQLGDVVQILEKVPVVGQRNGHQLPPGNNHRGRMDGVGGVGHQDHVPGLHRGQHQMRQALFGSDGGDGFGFGVDIHSKAAFVPIGDGHPEFGDPPGGGIAVVSPLARGFDELVHDVLRGGEVGIAHPQIDDVFPAPPGLHFDGVDRGKDIRRQALHAGEFFYGHAGLLRLTKTIFPKNKIIPKGRDLSNATGHCG